MGFLLAIVAAALGFFLPDFWLCRRIKARQKAILLAIPDTLDLLDHLGQGRPRASTPRSARSWRRRSGPLTDEFRRTLAEVRIGKARRDALREMVARTKVPALTNFISAIIQAEQLGVAIARVLEVQSEQLRIERRQRAEEMAAKAPIKMLFPLVGCIFPSMFIVILGPAIILIVHNLEQRLREPWTRTAPGEAPPSGARLVCDGSATAPSVCERVVAGRSFGQRFRGLMGRDRLDRREGLYLADLEHPHDVHALPDRRAVPGAPGRDRACDAWSACGSTCRPGAASSCPCGGRGVIELPAGTLPAMASWRGRLVFEARQPPRGGAHARVSAA